MTEIAIGLVLIGTCYLVFTSIMDSYVLKNLVVYSLIVASALVSAYFVGSWFFLLGE